MKINLLLFIFSIFLNHVSLGQKLEKIYYDEDWKVCKYYDAEYYRIISFDENRQPIGKVKDYYITGELQWEGFFSYVDKYDNNKDINEGLSIWYYKNGNKSRESNFVNGKEDGLTKFWYENGRLMSEIIYSNGVLDGIWNNYYKNGEVSEQFNFTNGKLEGKFFIECDEFGNCQNVFYENFSSKENLNNWNLPKNDNDIRSYIIPDKGLSMENYDDNGFNQLVHVPLSLYEDFSIETRVSFEKGDENCGHGLIWGFKDWDNYYYFVISANGYFMIGGRTEGIYLELKEWTKSNAINQNNKRNLLKILRVKDNIYFSINGQLVFSDDFYSFRGNYIGFIIISGKKKLLYEYLIVKQDIDNDFATLDNANFSGWKGNGTGFFISKNGYIATNYHVISEASDIEIEFIRNGQNQIYNATVVQSDKQNDLAILKINDYSFVPFNSLPYNFQTNIANVGENVFALGYPLALSVMGTEIKFTDGKISSKTGYQGNISTYQTTTPLQPGNSGGPLFDFDGNLVGVNSAVIRPDVADNVSYSIKASYLKNLVDVLPENVTLPNYKSIAYKTLTEKIKILSDYVVLIKVR